jgi:predicted deacetylase
VQKSKTPWFVLELHDISPARPDALTRMLEPFSPETAAKATLLVTPSWEGGPLLKKNSALAQSIKNHPGEIVLHGLTHMKGHNLFNRIFFNTANHAEFGNMSGPLALERISKGADILCRATGRRPLWFCAPRWKLAPQMGSLVLEQGFFGLMRMDGYQVSNRAFLPLPVISFDFGKRIWNQLSPALQRRVALAGCIKQK